ncbi:MAG: hypothetical protein DRJ02_10270 [Bacteroidetes bacterium]|nr:MAG: hypothetical protein DRJ02_10270 [Bacteroidota bacterium]
MEPFVLSDQSVGFLKEAKKWAYFLAILGFIGAGFLLLVGIMVSVLFSVIDVFAELPDKPDFPFGLIGIVYIALAVVYFFPAYYLYKFSKEISNALLVRDEAHLTSAFRFLKKHFKFIGIMIISLIAFYFVIIIIFVVVGLTTAMSSGTNLFV